jgi:hypothetical protein
MVSKVITGVVRCMKKTLLKDLGKDQAFSTVKGVHEAP